MSEIEEGVISSEFIHIENEEFKLVEKMERNRTFMGLVEFLYIIFIFMYVLYSEFNNIYNLIFISVYVTNVIFIAFIKTILNIFNYATLQNKKSLYFKLRILTTLSVLLFLSLFTFFFFYRNYFSSEIGLGIIFLIAPTLFYIWCFV